MKLLTPMEGAMLKRAKDFANEKGYPPTQRDVGQKNHSDRMFKALKKKGYISIGVGPRALRFLCGYYVVRPKRCKVCFMETFSPIKRCVCGGDFLP